MPILCWSHTNIVLGLCNKMHLCCQFEVKFIKQFQKMLKSKNSLVSYLAGRSLSDCSTYLGSQIKHLTCKYDVNIHQDNVCKTLVQAIFYKSVSDINNQSVMVAHIQEMMNVIDGELCIPGFTNTELKDNVHYITVI